MPMRTTQKDVERYTSHTLKQLRENHGITLTVGVDNHADYGGYRILIVDDAGTHVDYLAPDAAGLWPPPRLKPRDVMIYLDGFNRALKLINSQQEG